MTRSVRLSQGPEGDRSGILEDPGRVFRAATGARVLKDHLRTAVARCRVDGVDAFVKWFKPYRWYRRVEAALRGSPAARSWWAARDLAARGFRVPRILAVVEERAILPTHSWLVTGAVGEGAPAGRFWTEQRGRLGIAERRRLLEDGGRLLRRFHDLGFYTRDANPDNFFLRTGAEIEVFFLDLECMRRPLWVHRRRRRKNLVQLLRPVFEHLSCAGRARFLAAYLGVGPATGEFRRWWRAIERGRRRREREYRRRLESIEGPPPVR